LVPPVGGSDTALIEGAYEIAKRDLRSCYGELGIYAGPKNFREYWGRDSFFSSPGACDLGDYGVVRRNLELFRDHQRDDGLIPVRLDPRDHTLALLGIERPYDELKVRYKAGAPWSGEVADTSALYVISACDYAEKSGGMAWLKDNHASLCKALSHLDDRKNSLGLIDEDLVAGWADMTLKCGSTAYLNMLAWRANSRLGDLTGCRKKKAKAAELKEAIMENLWLEDEGYFADWIGRNGKVYRHFFADGNVLAPAWGLADAEKTQRIYSYIDRNDLAKVPIVACHPSLPKGMDLFIRAVFPNYHPSNVFTWLSPLEAMGRYAIDKAAAEGDLARFAKTIVDLGTVHEVLTPEGKPMECARYKSERQFAWASGTFIHAVHQMGLAPEEKFSAPFE
jgi:hypothetical protein